MAVPAQADWPCVSGSDRPVTKVIQTLSDNAGGLFVLGIRTETASPNRQAVVIQRINGSGNIAWDKEFNTSDGATDHLHPVGMVYHDHAVTIVGTVGEATRPESMNTGFEDLSSVFASLEPIEALPGGDSDLFAARITENGSKKYYEEDETPTSEWINAVAVDGYGAVYVAGARSNSTGGFNPYGARIETHELCHNYANHTTITGFVLNGTTTGEATCVKASTREDADLNPDDNYVFFGGYAIEGSENANFALWRLPAEDFSTPTVGEWIGGEGDDVDGSSASLHDSGTGWVNSVDKINDIYLHTTTGGTLYVFAAGSQKKGTGQRWVMQRHLWSLPTVTSMAPQVVNNSATTDSHPSWPAFTYWDTAGSTASQPMKVVASTNGLEVYAVGVLNEYLYARHWKTNLSSRATASTLQDWMLATSTQSKIKIADPSTISLEFLRGSKKGDNTTIVNNKLVVAAHGIADDLSGDPAYSLVNEIDDNSAASWAAVPVIADTDMAGSALSVYAGSTLAYFLTGTKDVSSTHRSYAVRADF